MRKITAILLLTALVSLAVWSCSQGEKKITLRFKYEPGLTLTYHQVSNYTEKVMIADSVIGSGTHGYEVDIKQEVKRLLNDTTAEILETDVFHIVGPSKEDSTKIDTVDTERQITLTVMNNGKFVNFDMAGSTDAGRKAYLRNFYEQGSPVFPSGEKAPGYSWTQTTKVVLPEETAEASTTYRIKSLVREAGYDCAVIEFDGNLILPRSYTEGDSVVHTGIERLKTNGVIYFAYREGFLLEQRDKWQLEADLRSVHKNGAVKERRVFTDFDVVYRLVKRETP